VRSYAARRSATEGRARRGSRRPVRVRVQGSEEMSCAPIARGASDMEDPELTRAETAEDDERRRGRSTVPDPTEETLDGMTFPGGRKGRIWFPVGISSGLGPNLIECSAEQIRA